MLIPPRKEETIQKLKDMVRQKEKQAPVIQAEEPCFAEVFLEEENVTPTPKTPSVAITPSSMLSNAKNQKILAMRRLSDGIRFSNRPYERLQAVLFYHQGKFMEDFTDDYDGDAPFFMYYPDYHSMSYVQLRTYFTWRTQFRNHIVKPIPLTYLYLYLYELINLIGVKDCHDALEKMIFLWSEYRAQEDSLDVVLKRWIKDFYILRNFDMPFEALIRENPFLADFFPLDRPKRPFETYAPVSDYKIKQSAFFNEGKNSAWIMDCFDHVITDINAFLSPFSANFDTLLYYCGSETAWAPFSNALYCSLSDDLIQIDRTRVFLGRRYHYKNQKWTQESKPLLLKNGRIWVGFLLRSIEQFYRQAVGYKRKMTPQQNKPDDTELLKYHIPPKDFYETIKRSILRFYHQSNLKTITVDTKNLEEIRFNALKVQERLILREEEEESLPEPPVPVPKEQKPPVDETEGDVWLALFKSLTKTEKNALRLLLHGCSEKEFLLFSKETGKLPEVLADELNQKALDLIGDTLFELGDEIAVFDDYQPDVERMLRLESE
jgi:hypothetical protein